ncbi:MAG TPA: MFS transporter [Burkholderiales bacterium]|nr:MFS transporter [Burkholderiales bacterium]
MNTVSATAAAAPRSYRDVWLISSGHAFTHWYTATFYLLLPLIGKELGLSYTEIGVIMTTQHIVGAISNLPGGMMVDMVGKKGYLMATSLFWVGFPYALMSLTHSYWMLLVCVTLVGIGNNLWHPAAITTLAYRYPERKGLVLSFHGMGGNVADGLAPLVVGALLTWFTWRTVVVVNVVPGLVMAALILIMLGAFTMGSSHDHVNAAGKSRGVKNYMKDFASLLRNRSLMLVSIGSSFRTMTQTGLLTFLPVYLAYELDYSPFLVGVCMSAMQVAGFAASPIGGHLSDKWGRKRIVMSSMVLTCVMIVFMALAGKSVLFVVFIALVGFFLYAMRPVLQAWAVEATPRDLAGSGVGLQFGIQHIGASIAPTIFGLIADASDIYTAFYFLAATILFANVLIVFMPNEDGRQAKAATA